MLITFRFPIADLRHFSADAEVATSVVLPRAWTDGDFVRGFGRVVRRESGAVEPWAHESAFADLKNHVKVDYDSLQGFEREFSDFKVQKIRKRAWMPLAESSSLLDVDLSFQVGSHSNAKLTYSRAGHFSLKTLADAIGEAAELRVRVGSPTAGFVSERLLQLGTPLSERFASQTSSIPPSLSKSVHAGRTVAVVEAHGITPVDFEGLSPQAYRIGNVTLLSFDVTAAGGGKVRCHVIFAPGKSKGDRKRIRELRIHVLRLHSIFEFLRCIAARERNLQFERAPYAQGAPGFDALQYALLACARVIRTPERPGGADSNSILGTAFFAKNFADRDLERLLERTISAMRPKVQNELKRLLQSEMDRERQDRAAQEASHQVETMLAMARGPRVEQNFISQGDNYGVFGSGNRVKNLSVSPAVVGFSAGASELSRDELVIQLRRMLGELESGGIHESSADLISKAACEIESGNDSSALRHLKAAGQGALKLAGEIGAAVAAAAIGYAIGIQ